MLPFGLVRMFCTRSVAVLVSMSTVEGRGGRETVQLSHIFVENYKHRVSSKKQDYLLHWCWEVGAVVADPSNSTAAVGIGVGASVYKERATLSIYVRCEKGEGASNK